MSFRIRYNGFKSLLHISKNRYDDVLENLKKRINVEITYSENFKLKNLFPVNLYLCEF